MDYGRLSWRGIIDVEADRVALRDDEGAPHDIRDLFVNVEDIGTVREVLTDIGGGFTHTTLTWNNEDDQPPTDDQVPGLASLLRFLDEDRPQKTYHIYATRNYRPVIDEYTFHSTKRVFTQNRTFEVPAIEPPLILKTKEIYRPTAIRPWVSAEPVTAPVRKGLVGHPGPRGRSLASLDINTFVLKGRTQQITVAPKQFVSIDASTFVLRQVRQNVENISQTSQTFQRQQLVPFEAPTVILRQSKGVEKEKNVSKLVFVSEPVPGLRGQRGEQGSRGLRGFAIVDSDVSMGRRGPQGGMGSRGPRGYCLVESDVSINRRGPQGDVGSRGPRGYCLMDSDVSISRRGPRGDIGSRGPRGFSFGEIDMPIARRGPTGVPGAAGKKGVVSADIHFIQKRIERNTVEKIHKIGFYHDVSTVERRTEQRTEHVKLRERMISETPAITLGRKGTPGARGVMGRSVTDVETLVQKTSRREIIRNLPKNFWFAPEAPVIFHKNTRQYSEYETRNFRSRGTIGLNEPPVLLLPKKGEKGPRGVRGAATTHELVYFTRHHSVATPTVTIKRSSSIHTNLESWPMRAVAKPGPPGKAGRPAFAQELTGHVVRKAVSITNVSKRAWNFAGDFFSSVTKRVYQVAAEYVSYAKPQVLTEEQALRALDNVRSLDYLLRLDRYVALSSEKKEQGQANLGVPLAYVAYDRPQANSEEEKLQARRNLGIPDSLKGDTGEQGPEGPQGPQGERGSDGANSSNIGELIGAALGAATAGGAIGSGLAGLLGRLFGGGGGLPGNVQDAINDAQEKITRGAVRYDTTQSLSSAEKARARANIGVSEGGGGGGEAPDLDGVLRFNVDQSGDVLPEEAARVRNTLRLPQTYLRLDVTQESNQIGMISPEAAALIRAALGIPSEMRHYHVRQILVQRDDHFLNLTVRRTRRHTTVVQHNEIRIGRRPTERE